MMPSLFFLQLSQWVVRVRQDVLSLLFRVGLQISKVDFPLLDGGENVLAKGRSEEVLACRVAEGKGFVGRGAEENLAGTS